MKYFAIIDGEQKGPFTLEELIAAGVRPDTYVWCKEMADWQHADEVADICRHYRNHLYEIMHPSTPEVAPGTENEGKGDAERKRKPEVRSIYQRTFMRGPEASPEIPEETPDYSVRPRSMLFEAILATLFCCPLTGIIAIAMSVRTNRLWSQGKNKEAHDAARAAKMWVGITLFMGFIVYAVLGQHAVR